MLKLALALSVGLASSSPVPAFLWSGESLFKGSCLEGGSNLHLSANDLVQGLQSFEKGKDAQMPLSLQQYTNINKEGVQTIVAFMFSEIDQSQLSKVTGAYANGNTNAHYLKDMLQKSKSCLTVPSIDYAVDTTLSAALAANGKSTSLKLEGASPKEACRALMSNLKSRSFSSSETDILLINVEKADNLNGECVQQVLSYVQQKSTSYLALVSADKVSCGVKLNFAEGAHNQRSLLSSPVGASKVYPYYTGPQYISGPILFGLLMGFFFISILLFVVSMMSSIQSPPRFPVVPLQIARES